MVEAAMDEMRLLGADVRFFAADIARRDEVARLIGEVDISMSPVRGIVHAAGVTADAVIGEQSWEGVESVLGPKLAGAWHLHELTAGRALDMFVMMSSASSVVGGPAQANYAAANAFLDALASKRRDVGLPGLSIGWGAWDRVGMTERIGDTDRKRMTRRGFVPLSVDDALAAFDAAQRELAGAGHVVAIALDRAALDDRPVLSALRTAAPTSPTAGLLAQWVETVPGMRRTVISSFVDEQAKRVLGLPSSSAIPARQPFNEIGLDSLMAVELRNAIGAALGRPQPATLLFDHPTSAALVDHLLGVVDELGGPDVKMAAVPTPPTAPSATDLELLADLSEAEAEAMLLAELGSMEPDA
jgi:acyl carrier protein